MVPLSCAGAHVIRRWLRDERGATSIEYALIALGVFLAIVTSVKIVGTNVQKPYQDVANNLTR
ncbi:MAG: Flp family type IVb pilin [Methylobacteriaceae bacterium]|nr:Flp family type IVb pilin [Methylobacteriaceae bacterium]